MANKGGCTPVSGVSRNHSSSLCAPIGHPHEHASTAGRPLRATIKVRFRVRRSDLCCHCLDLLRNPSLPLTLLAGKLDDSMPGIGGQEALARLLTDSPEVKLAEQGITRAELALKRAQAEPRPDSQIGAELDYNRELLCEVGSGPVGWEGAIEVGLQVPIFNRNQGNVKAAAAELAHARSESDRVRLSLRASDGLTRHRSPSGWGSVVHGMNYEASR